MCASAHIPAPEAPLACSLRNDLPSPLASGRRVSEPARQQKASDTMRILLPAVAAATALTIGLAPAAAQSERKHDHERQRSHVSLHLSTHTLLAGNGLAVRGKVRPSGRQRVKLVFRGPDRAARGVTTKANGTFALRWAPGRTGTYAVRAYGVHDRRVSGSRSAKRKLTSYRLAGASYYG